MNFSGILQVFVAFAGTTPLIQRLLFASMELAAVGLAIAVLIRVGRVRSPRMICFLWLLVLVKPLVSLCVGSPVAIIRLDTSLSSSAPVADRAVAPAVPDVENETALPADSGRNDVIRASSASSGGAAPASPVDQDQAQERTWTGVFADVSLAGGILSVWLAGIAVFLVAHLLARLRLQRFIRTAQPATPALRTQYCAMARQLQLKRVPDLAVTDSLESPAIIGLLRPTVLLPSWLVAEGNSRKQDWAIRHELTHWRRLDPLSVLIRDIVVILFWFHPVVWWSGRRFVEAMELACDRAMVHTPSDAAEYAEQLFGILQNLCERRRPVVAGGLFATRTQVGNRISALLDGTFANPPKWTALSVLGVTVLTGAALAVGVAAPIAAVSQVSVMAADAERVLHFPNDQSLGRLYMLDAGIPRVFDAESFTYTVDSPDMRWAYLGEASGDVKVPAGKRVRLVVNDKCSDNLSSLSKLQPDDLYDLILGKAVDSKCLAYVAHLTGLKSIEFPYAYPETEKLPVITAQALKQLAKLKSLERMRAPSRMTDESLKTIAEALPQLKVLSFGPNQVTDKGLASLAKLRSLEEISLGDGRFTNAGLANLTGLPSLHYVWLWGTAETLEGRITDDALAQLKKIGALRTLKLPSIITDAGLAHLKVHPKLENLWLHDAKVTDGGMVYLKSLPSLKVLNLNKMNFDRKNPPLTDMATAHLKEIKTLEDVRLPGDGLTDAGLANLAGLSHLKHLELPMPSYNDPKNYLNPYTAGGIEALSKVSTLEALSLAGPGVTDATLSHVAKLTNLRKLTLFGCPIGNEGLAKLASLKSLETLELINYIGSKAPQLTMSGLNPLNGLSNLTRIQVNDLGRDDVALNLSGLTRLEYLMLSCAKGVTIRDEDLAGLAGLKQLKWLQVGGGSSITDKGMSYLAGLTSLERLTLGGDGITDRGMASLAGMSRLDNLRIGGNFTDEGALQLEGLTNLQYLWLKTGKNLSAAAKERLRKSLPNLINFTANNETVVGISTVLMGAYAPGARSATAAPAKAAPAAVPVMARPAAATTTRPSKPMPAARPASRSD